MPREEVRFMRLLVFFRFAGQDQKGTTLCNSVSELSSERRLPDGSALCLQSRMQGTGYGGQTSSSSQGQSPSVRMCKSPAGYG